MKLKEELLKLLEKDKELSLGTILATSAITLHALMTISRKLEQTK